MDGSLLLKVSLELLSESPVGLESSITSLLSESWVPVIELVETVTEAKTLLHSQKAHVFLLSAFGVASVVQVCQDSVVLLNLKMEEVFGTELGALESLIREKRLAVSFLLTLF